MEIEEIVSQYSERLLRYATSILYDYQEAEDTVQDVFMSAYQKMANFEGENISAWLYKITYNKCLNRLKQRKILPFSEVPMPAVIVASNRSQAHEEVVNVGFDQRFAEAQLGQTRIRTENPGLTDATLKILAQLKPQERALLYGRIIEGYSYGELAIQMGQSATALRKRYERARQKYIKISEGGRM